MPRRRHARLPAIATSLDGAGEAAQRDHALADIHADVGRGERTRAVQRTQKAQTAVCSTASGSSGAAAQDA